MTDERPLRSGALAAEAGVSTDTLRFYVDNRLVHEVRGGRIEEMRRPQRLYLQLWNSAELHRWVGHIDPSEAPWVLTVACVAQGREYRGVSLCAS